MGAEIFDAIAGRDLDRLAHLLEEGADPNAVRPDSKDWSALNEAIDQVAQGAGIDGLVLLLRFGAHPDGKPSLRSAPLLHALFRELHEVAWMLLARGADPNCVGVEGDCPLRHCVEMKDPAMVSLLLRCGATQTIDVPGEPWGLTALGMAARRLEPDLVSLLLRFGADPRALDNDGRMAFEQMPARETADEKRWMQVEALLRSQSSKGP